MNHAIIYDTFFESLSSIIRIKISKQSNCFSDPKLSKLLQRLSQKNLFGSCKLK